MNEGAMVAEMAAADASQEKIMGAIMSSTGRPSASTPSREKSQ
jgi:putative multiple sugar transport system ATP-binding protein